MGQSQTGTNGSTGDKDSGSNLKESDSVKTDLQQNFGPTGTVIEGIKSGESANTRAHLYSNYFTYPDQIKPICNLTVSYFLVVICRWANSRQDLNGRNDGEMKEEGGGFSVSPKF